MPAALVTADEATCRTSRRELAVAVVDAPRSVEQLLPRHARGPVTGLRSVTRQPFV